MTQYRMTHPYNAGFAFPANVMAEPPGRGTLTTKQLPRKTFSAMPEGWTGGFALPDYVKAEPHKRGTMHTHWTRRKTIPTLIPASLGNDFPDEVELEYMLEEGEPLEMILPQEVYAMDGLGSSEVLKGRGDPIKLYGERASEYILGTIREVPVEFRAIALEALLDEVEPGLYDRVTERANKYRGRGMSSKTAVQAAMASSMSQGIAKEMMQLGRGKAPDMRSQLGLGLYGDTAIETALEGLWGSLKKGVKKVGSAVKKSAQKIGSGVKRAGKKAAWPAQQAYKGVRKGAEYVKKGVQRAYEWGKNAINKLGSLACGAMKSPVASVAAGAAAAAYGAPPQVGAAGAQIGGSLCSKSEIPAVPQQELVQPQQYGTSKWILPAVIGGAGLLVVLLVTRK